MSSEQRNFVAEIARHAQLPLHAGKPSSSAPDLSERATIHWALFKKKLLNDLIFFIAYFLYSCVLFLISIIPKSGLVLGLEESSVFEVVNCCWTVYPVSHIPGMWRTPTQPQIRTEETLWTPQTPCSWLLPAVTPFAVECPKAIVWQWHLLKTPRNLKTTVDVARDFHIAILVNTTRGFTF